MRQGPPRKVNEMLDELIRKMLYCKQYESAARRYMRTEDVETFRRKHDEIRQQIKELLDFDAFIQSVEI